MIEHYRQGAFSVRHDPMSAGAPVFAVFFDYGFDGEPRSIPATVTRADGQGVAMHPAYVGQKPPYGMGATFRTKTGAKRYMQAVAGSGILPEDRPATKDEIRALRDWIEKESER